MASVGIGPASFILLVYPLSVVSFPLEFGLYYQFFVHVDSVIHLLQKKSYTIYLDIGVQTVAIAIHCPPN